MAKANERVPAEPLPERLERLVNQARTGGRTHTQEPRTSPQEMILDATERLLTKQALNDLSVRHILDEAGVSRTTFYYYFTSKYAVVNALAARAMSGVYGAMVPFVERDENESPEEALRRSLQGGWAAWTEHRVVLEALHANWHAVPEFREVWLAITDGFAGAITAEIEAERAAGLAPDGVDARQLASALVWSTAQCMYIAGQRVDVGLPDEDTIFEPLLAMWLGAIYHG
jgi:AcrR family transcriptional regulator